MPPTTSTGIGILPDLVLRIIIGKLELGEQILLRRVCRKWKFEAESFITRVQYVKLDITDRYDRRPKAEYHAHDWAPAFSMQRFLFERSWREPQLAKDAKGVCTIRSDLINRRMIASMRELLSNVQTLVIYFDFADAVEDSVKAFLRLLCALYPLNSLSIIQCRARVDRTSLKRIYAAIEQNSVSFTRLDICFCPYINFGENPTRKVDLKLPNATRLVQHLSVPSNIKKLVPFLQDIGKGNDGQNGLVSLSLECELDDEELEEVTADNRQVNQIRALQLNNILDDPRDTDNIALDHLDQFPNLERLTLHFFKNNDSLFSFKWLQPISLTLRRLTELNLVNITLDSPEYEYYHTELSNIRKLTIGSHNFVSRFVQMSDFPRMVPQEAFLLIARVIAKQFPRLEELSIFASDELEYCYLSEQLYDCVMRAMPNLRVLTVDLDDENLNERG